MTRSPERGLVQQGGGSCTRSPPGSPFQGAGHKVCMAVGRGRTCVLAPPGVAPLRLERRGPRWRARSSACGFCPGTTRTSSWYPGAGTGVCLSLLLPGPPPLPCTAPRSVLWTRERSRGTLCPVGGRAGVGGAGGQGLSPLITVPFSRLFEAGKISSRFEAGLSSFCECVCFS